MQKKSLSYKNSTISYAMGGQGKDIIIALHGYGENAENFSFLESHLQNDFSIIAIDFPFHGESIWNDDLIFTAKNLYEIIYKLIPVDTKQFYLLGYSMGGRVALQFLEQYPETIKRLILIAPDGLYNNFWHQLATQTIIGNRIFKFTMQYPAVLFFLINFFYSFRLINKSIYNFVNYYLGDAASRMLLYKRWTIMRKFHPDIALLKSIIHKDNILIKILFGKHDSVILTKRGLNFKTGIEKFVEIKEIDAGHQLLKEKYAEDIVTLFKS